MENLAIAGVPCIPRDNYFLGIISARKSKSPDFSFWNFSCSDLFNVLGVPFAFAIFSITVFSHLRFTHHRKIRACIPPVRAGCKLVQCHIAFVCVFINFDMTDTGMSASFETSTESADSCKKVKKRQNASSYLIPHSSCIR